MGARSVKRGQGQLPPQPAPLSPLPGLSLAAKAWCGGQREKRLIERNGGAAVVIEGRLLRGSFYDVRRKISFSPPLDRCLWSRVFFFFLCLFSILWQKV